MGLSKLAPLPLLLVAAVNPAPAAVVGSIAGLVTDDRGVPQISATVQLLSADGRTLQRVFTNETGAFLIDNLFPGVYGVRVSLPSFLPAIKEKILVRAGVSSRLQVQLANLFASIQLVYPREGEWRDMTEDWKWVLRTASSTRPVLRLAPWEDSERRSVLGKLTGAFGPVQGLVQLSAGDGGRLSAFGSESELGTAFAVATSLFGNNNLLVSGNLGYGSTSGAPSAGFHTSFRREMPYGAQPEISLTVRQMFRPVQAGRVLFGPRNVQDPNLQAFAVGLQDQVSLGDLLKLEYGFQYDSISFLDRLQYVSSFGRLAYSVDDDTQVALSFAGGVPRPDFGLAGENALGRNLSALGLYPRMSLRGGRPSLQRGQHMEVALQQKLGDDVIEVAAYRDSFSNVAVTGLLPAGLYARGDVLPDLFSDASSFNAGSYETTGYRVSYLRRLSDHVTTALSYGLTGALAPGRDSLATDDATELRALLKLRREHFLTALVSAQVPRAGTRITSSYQWAPHNLVTSPDLFNASASRALPGMNLTVRQPLPDTVYLPGKFEATAEFRDMLAQGYVPIRTADGRRLFLLQSARSFRGGFNFVF